MAFIEKKFFHLGGYFTYKFLVETNSLEDIEVALQVAKDRLIKIEMLMSEFTNSYIAEINKFAGIRPVIVPDDVFNLIKKSLVFSKITEGSFDITFAPINKYLRQCMAGTEVFSQKQYQEIKQRVDYSKVILNETERKVYLPETGAGISLGGIGKGYAVDEVYNIFRKHGLNNFLINGNGDLKVHSAATAKRNWRIGIKNPLNPQLNVALMELANMAMATSGNYRQDYSKLKKGLGHIYSEKESDFISVTVLHPETMYADVFATSIFNMPLAQSLKFINENKLKVYLVKKDHTIFQNLGI